MGIEVVEDGMDLLVRIDGDDVVHEGKELDAPAALLVGGGHLARRQIERGKQLQRSRSWHCRNGGGYGKNSIRRRDGATETRARWHGPRWA